MVHVGSLEREVPKASVEKQEIQGIKVQLEQQAHQEREESLDQWVPLVLLVQKA